MTNKTPVTLVTLLTNAVAVEQSFTKAKGDFDRALLAVAAKATDDMGFAWPVKDAPNYSADKVTELKDAVTKAFTTYTPDYQRKIWQRITDHAADYILSETAPKKIAALVAELDDEQHEAMSKKADRTIAGQTRVANAKKAKEAADKNMPPLSKEARAAKAQAELVENIAAYLAKTKTALCKLGELDTQNKLGNSVVAALHNINETRLMFKTDEPTEG